MKKHFSAFMLMAGLLVPATLLGQQKVVEVNREKYTDYTNTFNPDYTLLGNPLNSAVQGKSKSGTTRPDHINNAENKYFPPVFNQDGGSCGSASRISYMFSYELAAYRNVDGSKPENYYPSHFVWLLTNAPNNQGKDAFVEYVGVPSAATYGGQTYSSLFGNQDTSQDDFGWMQGYDKWFEAMHNRMLRPMNFPQSIKDEAGREAVKNWLWNHSGDESFYAGGICGIGVASGGVWKNIPKTATNDEIGVTGMDYVYEWGTQVDHALTIVGYDDRVEFDLDKDGKYGEADADERGAWIIVNSWGNTWCNGGFIYCPYAFAGSAFKNDGNPGNRTFNGDFWWPEIYRVRKDYRPLRTIKLEMEYSHRSEISLSAGISSDINASEPEKTVPFVHFQYAGDGNYGNTKPAPAIPMLGRWADGKLHKEPMEFGYDLTDLSDKFDKNMPLKYFFIVDTKSWAAGNGKIHRASIIDYEHDVNGIETPFDLTAEGVEIKNAGNKTIISVVVYGENYYSPQNLAFDGKTLSWQAPLRSNHKVASYNIYRDQNQLEQVAASTLQYEPANADQPAQYSVSAIYEDGTESAMISINSPIVIPARNATAHFKQSGFSIPNIFGSTFNQATIEYWINPTSLVDWNQSGGPGWGTFMFHANGNGKFTVGWDTSNRCNSSAALKTNQWNHVAIVVDKNTMTIYINGNKSGSVTSSSYSGIGGFGDLTFSANGTQNAQNAKYDEIRIWNTARTKDEIFANKNIEYSGSLLPNGLIAYFKGDTLHTSEGDVKLRDCVGGNHAKVLNANFAIYETSKTQPKLTAPNDELFAEINEPNGDVFVGLPVKISAKHSNSTASMKWTVADANIENMSVEEPTIIFKTPGEQEVSLTVTNYSGEELTVKRTITVEKTPEINANFVATSENIPAGERVTFLANAPILGYLYEWSMPGADIEEAFTINAAATYQKKGDYTVTLKVTAPTGETKSTSKKISVVEVAPKADFDIAPAVINKGETTFLRDKSKFAPNQWQWHISGTGSDYIINGQHSSFSPEKPGVYDITLNVSNDTGNDQITRPRGLIVCNADSKNGLNFGNGGASIETKNLPFTENQKTFTIEWWMNPSNLTTFCNGIGDNESNFVLKTNANGAMQIYINKKNTSTSTDYVVAGEWHHYAVVFNSGTATFYIDGTQFIKKSVGWAKVPEMSKFAIGSALLPMTGQIDEFRIWNTALTVDEIKQYANEPINDVKKAEEDGLVLYYTFNQNGGDVQDATSQQNHGQRNGFGPDGDAWGLSKGVFCLNFETNEKNANVTEKYLKNYTRSFSYDADQCVNPNLSTRTFAIKDWTLENAVIDGNITTGVHVDRSKNNCFTVTTEWDNFAVELTNHKAYQTITLPAGSYTFKATYDGSYEGQCGNSYLVAALGETLPDVENLADGSIGYERMLPKSSTCLSNSLTFILNKEETISLGLLINMSGKSCMALQSFILTRSSVISMEADGANGYDLQVDADGYHSLYLPYPVEIPEGVTAYCVKEVNAENVTMAAIEDGVIPSRTGVIIEAEPGDYHFAPSSRSGKASSLLIGSTVDTDAEGEYDYYEFVADGEQKGFSKYTSSTLWANHAYLKVKAGSLPENLDLNIIETGIGELHNDMNSAKDIYDLSGRKVKKATNGVYIVNGKKLMIK